jgi:hypothetical protein
MLALLSCGHSPSAPMGHLLVTVMEDRAAPAPGKLIQVVGTGLLRNTDSNGEALFHLPAGSYVVRAYAIGTPGPERPYVEQNVTVEAGHTSEAGFVNCDFCR